jgi:hypothetical protein
MNPAVPANTVQALVAMMKAKPDAISYAWSGNATTSHVACAMELAQAGVQAMHVPYKGSAPAVTDLIGGQVCRGRGRSGIRAAAWRERFDGLEVHPRTDRSRYGTYRLDHGELGFHTSGAREGSAPRDRTNATRCARPCDRQGAVGVGGAVAVALLR